MQEQEKSEMFIDNDQRFKKNLIKGSQSRTLIDTIILCQYSNADERLGYKKK